VHVDGTACDNFHPFVVQANLARPLVLFVFSLAVSTSEKNCGVALAVAKPTSFKIPEHLGYSSCSTLKLLPIHDTISLGSHATGLHEDEDKFKTPFTHCA